MLNLNYDKLLEGKNAVVTSGAHGMGKYIAKVFARHGARVAINGLKSGSEGGDESAEALCKMTPGSFFKQCDMSKREDVESFIAEVLERFGHVDAVVNNCGINLNEPIEKLDDERYDRTIQVNIRGVIRMARGFIPGMIKAGGGTFVHISSVHSVSGIPFNFAYASSKAAINGFSGALAADYAKYNIRSNVINPGGIYSGNNDVILPEMLKNPKETLRQVEYFHNSQPDYAAGSSYDIGNTSLFLSCDMSRMVTGAVIMVDGAGVLQSQALRNRRIPPDSDELWLEHLGNRYTPFI